MEKYLDEQSLTDPHVPGFVVDPESLKPVRLSLDLKVTHALRDELTSGMEHWKAKAAAGVVMDVNTGEVVALESLPDYDPNVQFDAHDPTKINRINVGVYEMGSTFKALSIAMALDSGKVNLGTRIDARDSLRYGRFTIHDFHATHRILTVPEVFTHSSNIGTARMALMVGVTGHQAFLKKMGQLDRLRTELPESAEPLVPKRWTELNTMTIAFGQGLNVAPLQALMAVSALVNGGHMMPPTFLPRSQEEADKISRKVVSDQTSESMRYLMRSNATHGSASFANIPGYTSAARRARRTRSSTATIRRTRCSRPSWRSRRPRSRNTLSGDLRRPVAAPGDYGYHTAAWNAGRTTGALIEESSRCRACLRATERRSNPFPIIARLGYGADADKIGKE